MSKQSAYPVLTETDLSPVIATSTGTSHTLTVTVRTDGTFGISDSKLRIKNGDKVIWSLGSVKTTETPIITFSGTVVRGNISGTRGHGDVSHEVLKELKTHPLAEPYSVSLKAEDGTEKKLTYAVSTTTLTSALNSDPPPPTEPYLMIDNIGDPPGGGTGPKDPCDPRGDRR